MIIRYFASENKLGIFAADNRRQTTVHRGHLSAVAEQPTLTSTSFCMVGGKKENIRIKKLYT